MYSIFSIDKRKDNNNYSTKQRINNLFYLLKCDRVLRCSLVFYLILIICIIVISIYY